MKIFLSFTYKEDIRQVNDFRSILENPSANLNFIDGSCKKDYAGKSEKQIRKYINSLIDEASVTVCLISKKTKQSDWVGWELDSSTSKKKGIIGIIMKNKQSELTSIQDCPIKFHSGRYNVIEWSSPEQMAREIQKAEKRR